jgi:hypothetical protein
MRSRLQGSLLPDWTPAANGGVFVFGGRCIWVAVPSQALGAAGWAKARSRDLRGDESRRTRLLHCARSEAIRYREASVDCFGARAPRNDETIEAARSRLRRSWVRVSNASPRLPLHMPNSSPRNSSQTCILALAAHRARVRPGIHRPHQTQGRREGRALAAPVAPVRTKSTGQEPQVWPTHPASPARWLYDLYAISPGTGSFAPVACELVAPQT